MPADLNIPSTAPKYRRVLLKLSGEALMGSQTYGIDPAIATQIAREIGEIQELGVQTAVVIGGPRLGDVESGLVAAAVRGRSETPSSLKRSTPRSP